MKILIATGIYPPDFRGPATLLEALPGALRAKGFEVKIITYSDIPGTKSEEQTDGVWRVLRRQNILSRPVRGAASNGARYLKYFWRMRQLAKWADVVYVTDVYSVGYFAYLIKKLSGKKYIVRFAGDAAWETAVARGWTQDYIVDFEEKKYNAEIEKLKERRRRILLGADRIVAVSFFLAGLAEKIGAAREKISVIYNSVDFMDGAGNNDFLSAVEVDVIKNRYGRDARIIISAGQLAPWKGFDGLIKILPELIKKIGVVNLLILGEGQELANLKDLTKRLGVSERVYFLGKISHQEILNYFAAADLFVLNSNYEGLSHTLLEAMKAGAPVLASNAGGNPEVIENGKEGLLVPYNNEEKLLSAAARILSDKNLAQTFRAAAYEKLKMFNWALTVAKTAEAIRRAADK